MIIDQNFRFGELIAGSDAAELFYLEHHDVDCSRIAGILFPEDFLAETPIVIQNSLENFYLDLRENHGIQLYPAVRSLGAAVIEFKKTSNAPLGLSLFTEFARLESQVTTLQEGQTANADLYFGCLEPIAARLADMHSKGLLHGDLGKHSLVWKDANILELLGSFLPGTVNCRYRPLCAVGGDAWYSSPEQVLGEDLSAASDIFSFAAFAYELLNGSKPFAGEDRWQTMQLILLSEVPPSSKAAEVFAWGLTKDPSYRPDSVVAWVAELKKALMPANGMAHTMREQRRGPASESPSRDANSIEEVEVKKSDEKEKTELKAAEQISPVGPGQAQALDQTIASKTKMVIDQETGQIQFVAIDDYVEAGEAIVDVEKKDKAAEAAADSADDKAGEDKETAAETPPPASVDLEAAQVEPEDKSEQEVEAAGESERPAGIGAGEEPELPEERGDGADSAAASEDGGEEHTLESEEALLSSPAEEDAQEEEKTSEAAPEEAGEGGDAEATAESESLKKPEPIPIPADSAQAAGGEKSNQRLSSETLFSFALPEAVTKGEEMPQKRPEEMGVLTAQINKGELQDSLAERLEKTETAPSKAKWGIIAGAVIVFLLFGFLFSTYDEEEGAAPGAESGTAEAPPAKEQSKTLDAASVSGLEDAAEGTPAEGAASDSASAGDRPAEESISALDPELEKLQERLQSEDFRELITAIKEVSAKNAVVLLPEVIELSRHPEFSVRVNAVRVLSEKQMLSDKYRDDVLAALFERLEEEDEIVRGFAAKALGQLGDTTALTKLRGRLDLEESEVVLANLRRAIASLEGMAK